MKYLLMIYQGSTPLPGTPEWEQLSAEQQGAVYAGYKAVNETPGMTRRRPQRPSGSATAAS